MTIATGIPRPALHHAWPDLWPMLKPAYEKSRDKTDLLAGLMSKDLQLWAVYEHNKPVAGIVSKLSVLEGTSSTKNAVIWLVGGVRLSKWSPDFLSKFIPWARAEGCSAISGGGRKGWARLARHYGATESVDKDGKPFWSLPI